MPSPRVPAPPPARKRVRARWGAIDSRLQLVDGLDDLMLFDLNFLCNQMQPPVERQYSRAAPVP